MGGLKGKQALNALSQEQLRDAPNTGPDFGNSLSKIWLKRVDNLPMIVYCKRHGLQFLARIVWHEVVRHIFPSLLVRPRQ